MRKRNATARIDLLITSIGALFAFIVAFYFEAFENFESWAQRYERWEIDELIVVPVVFALALGFFYWRRWRELKDEVARRQRAEEGLRENEERFRSLVQNASDIIMIMKANGEVSYVSPAVEWVLGYKPEDIVGTDSYIVVHPDDLVRVQNSIADAMSEPGFTSSMELRLQHADGSWRHIETQYTNLLHDPAVNGVIINSRDVTGRKRAEEALRESEEKYRTLVEAVQEGIGFVDTEERVTYCNQAYAAIFDLAPQELIGTSLFEFLDEEQQQRL